MIIQIYATMVRRIHITDSENRFNFRAAKGQLLSKFLLKLWFLKEKKFEDDGIRTHSQNGERPLSLVTKPLDRQGLSWH